MLAGRLDDAHAFAERALALARTYQERGHHTYALRLLGDIYGHRDPPEIDQAETYYQQTLTLADELGMRPLQAHCHRGLGTLYSQTGQAEQARAALSTAIEMYREMEMTFWFPEAAKRLLQTASVLGRAFPLRLLEAVWEESGVLVSLLQELKRLEFLYERTGEAELVYVFKHALTQEVASESLLTTRRHTLHGAAGAALERLYATRLGDVYDRLAYHYARTEEAAKAVAYLMRFADKVARGYAHVEAVTALQEALTHTERLPAAERDRGTLELIIRLSHSFYLLGRLSETLDFSCDRRNAWNGSRTPC